MKRVRLTQLDAGPLEPRRVGVSQLVASIREDGLREPLTVVPEGDRYRVVSGRRRLAALLHLILADARVWTGHGYRPARLVYRRVPCEVVEAR